jgi:uncharacterized tellurite resistance protein B-like protein
MADPFDPNEAQEVARALAAVAAADGAAVEREVQFLEGFAVKYGVGAVAWIATPLDEVSLARAVSDPEKRRTVVMLCLEMAFSDKDYSPEEKEMIQRIAAALGVSEKELADLTLSARVAR